MVTVMEKFSDTQAADIMNKAREHMRRPLMEIPIDTVPPVEDRLARFRREHAEQEAAEREKVPSQNGDGTLTEAAEVGELAALREDHDRLQARVRDMGAEIEGLRDGLFDVLRASREAIDGLDKVGEDRGRPDPAR